MKNSPHLYAVSFIFSLQRDGDIKKAIKSALLSEKILSIVGVTGASYANDNVKVYNVPRQVIIRWRYQTSD